ncbi:MAG TPA: alpha/beta hydrolase [Phycisphaerae bacterium]|nr:alpha/beta hydrolase [Phycisphaerae bacterium]
MEASAVSGPTPVKKRSRKGGILIRLLIYVIAIYGIWCAGLYFLQDRLLFPAEMAPAPAPSSDRYDPRTVELTLPIEPEGKIVAWFIPPPKKSAGRASVAIIFHGNAEIIDYLDEIVEPYRRMGFAIFLPEYRGYGRSSGTPSEAALISDAVRFYDELLKRPDIDPNRIVIHARSLGGGPACALAAQRKCRALVLQSVFTSTADMAMKYGGPPFLARNPFHNDRIIPTLEIPILIAHGCNDEIIPVAQGRSLAKLARHGTYLEYDCRHNGFPGDGKEDEYWGKVAAFLREAGVMDSNR